MKKYGNWTKFNEITNKEKIFRIINIIISILLLGAGIGLSIYYSLTGDKNARLFACISLIVFAIAPFIIELILRRRISGFVVFYYLLYVILADLIGCALNVYNILSWWDIVIHILAGYTFAVVGIFIISRLEKYKSLKPLTIVIFCLFFTLGVELIWELCEWTYDSLFHQSAQGIPVAGFGAPLVLDTDLDLLCNLIGGIIFSIQFLIDRFTKINLGINIYEDALCPKEKITSIENKKSESNTDSDLDNTDKNNDNINASLDSK